MQIVKDSPYGWAAEKAGWVLLHEDEDRILQVMMKSMRAVELKEVETALFEGGKKQRFYRLHVDNLRLAYEFLFMARVTGW